jgi:hypothetical protein
VNVSNIEHRRQPSRDQNKSVVAGTFIDGLYLLFCPILDALQPVDTMKKILLATVAILAFATPSFAAEPAKTAADPAKTVGQAPPSGASTFYLAQDTATMKCQVVNAQPAAGGSLKAIGAAHPTQASAQTALTADKTCKQ